MENIQRALNRVKNVSTAPNAPLAPYREETRTAPVTHVVREVHLNRDILERERIVAHDRLDERTKSFDMLRTQVLQAMDTQRAQSLAITSPTAGCGKTVNAINLAFSLARQPERSVLLIDLDLNGPQIAKRLGIECEVGLIDVLNGKAALADAVFQVRVGAHELLVLPSKGTSEGRRDWPSAKALGALLKDLKQEDPSRIIILDLPPLLSGDEVISVLPHVDGVLFVVAAGVTTQVNLKECEKHLQGSAIVRVVLNKSPEPGIAPYGVIQGVEERRLRRFWRRKRR